MEFLIAKMSNSVCRVCLASDLRMLCIESIGLKEIYESVTNTKLNTEDERPLAICYICCSQLQRCQRFREMSRRAEQMFTDILDQGIEITHIPVQILNFSIKHDLSVTTIELMSFNDNLYNEKTSVAVKEELNLIEQSSSSTSMSVDDIEDNETISWETDHTLDLGMKDSTVNKGQHISSDDENIPAAVKEEINQDEECSTGNIEDETVTNIDSSQVKTHTTMNDRSDFCCDICSKTLETKESMVLHLQIHNRKGIYACPQCDKKFVSIRSFETHVKIHPGLKPFACSQCGKTFFSKNHLRRHIRVHSGENTVICHHCNKKFSEKGNLLKHLRLHTGEKPYACSQCDRKFTMNNHLQIHLRSHAGGKKFACHQCKKSFCSSHGLRIHIKCHAEERPFACSQCKKAYTLKINLIIHMRSHTGEKPYACSNCKKAFAKNSHLRRHIKIHTGEKPFACSQCKKSYSRSCHLKRHELTHT